MRPVEHTSTSSASQPELGGHERAHALGVVAARVAGGGVGVAAVEDDRRGPAAGRLQVGPA